ncbi:unnamed protein product [Sphenostylis stenocarpa]|uniref:Reverse transcriptase n=1 Tax=Sphenostylis stenocarpa TaxID=92480 RepID=A0AA86VN79_9FABA|nr:unnamed protein product [Sphenostylis stenocarpa]
MLYALGVKIGTGRDINVLQSHFFSAEEAWPLLQNVDEWKIALDRKLVRKIVQWGWTYVWVVFMVKSLDIGRSYICGCVGIKELIESCLVMHCEEGQNHVKMHNMVRDGVWQH